MQGKLYPRDEAEKQKALEAGYDLEKVGAGSRDTLLKSDRQSLWCTLWSIVMLVRCLRMSAGPAAPGQILAACFEVEFWVHLFPALLP